MTEPTRPLYGSAPPPGGHEHTQPYGVQDSVSPAGPPPYAPMARSAPGQGRYGYAAAPPPPTATLGWVALVAGVIALVGSLANALIAVAVFDPTSLDDQSPDGTIGLVAAVGLANLLIVWFGFGLWAIVQGIVAIVTKRGVGPGIGALILGLIGPWVGVTVVAIGLALEVAEYSSQI